jgi:hypothetical protein
MVSLNRRRILIALMFTWFVLTPYVVSVGNINLSFTPINKIELSAPTITGPTFYQYEN